MHAYTHMRFLHISYLNKDMNTVVKNKKERDIKMRG